MSSHPQLNDYPGGRRWHDRLIASGGLVSNGVGSPRQPMLGPGMYTLCQGDSHHHLDHHLLTPLHDHSFLHHAHLPQQHDLRLAMNLWTLIVEEEVKGPSSITKDEHATIVAR